jgi:hypothetical protein
LIPAETRPGLMCDDSVIAGEVDGGGVHGYAEP